MDLLRQEHPQYIFPGFLFYSGQLVVTGSKFNFSDFQNILIGKEMPKPRREDIFVGEDQGILNFIVAEKLRKGQISYRDIQYMIERWSAEINSINFDDVLNKKPHPFLVHWNGPKHGFLSFLPQSKLLFFFEGLYYSKLKNGNIKKHSSRLTRSVKNGNRFLYETAKKILQVLKLKRS